MREVSGSDGQPYDPNRIDRTLMLGGATNGRQVKSRQPPFPYPRQPVPNRQNHCPDGKTDVSAPGAVDNFGKDANGSPVVDPQYRGLKGVWKDTLFVKNLASGQAGQYTVVYDGPGCLDSFRGGIS
jgi:hypothetical protein